MRSAGYLSLFALVLLLSFVASASAGCDESNCDPSVDCVPEIPAAGDASVDASPEAQAAPVVDAQIAVPSDAGAAPDGHEGSD